MEVGAAPERRSSGQFSSTSSPRLGEVLVWWGSRSPGIEKSIHKTPPCSRHQSKAVTGQPFSFLLQRRSGKKSLTSSTKRDRPKPSTRGQLFSPPPTFPPSSHMAVRLQCGKGEPGEACPHFQHQAASWSSSTDVMKGRRRGANCAEICSIDVGENEPIDPQRKNAEIETANLTVLTNSSTAANPSTSMVSFVLFRCLHVNWANIPALMFSGKASENNINLFFSLQ